MPKALLLMRRKPGITKEQFREHYENNHVKLAQKHIGHLLTGYRRNYPITAVAKPTDPINIKQFELEYDAVTELWFKDEAALAEVGRLMLDPVIQPIFVSDEWKFVDRDSIVFVICDEVDTGVALR